MHTFREHCNTLASRTSGLEERAEAAEAQCAELLDFIEVTLLNQSNEYQSFCVKHV
jgi:hypothetical protein